MGDMQFDGTQEEWDALVKKNKSKSMTAVEWIVDQMLSEGHKEMWKDMIQQAKQMEKEQIIEAYCQGCKDISEDDTIFPRETSEEYYNKFYNPKNQIK